MSRDDHKVLIPANPTAAQSKPVPAQEDETPASASPAHIPGLMPEKAKVEPTPHQKHQDKQAQAAAAKHAEEHKKSSSEDEDEEKKGIGGKISDFIKQSERVLAVTHKPGEAEYKRIALSTALGITILGVLGLFISALGAFVRGV